MSNSLTTFAKAAGALVFLEGCGEQINPPEVNSAPIETAAVDSWRDRYAMLLGAVENAPDMAENHHPLSSSEIGGRHRQNILVNDSFGKELDYEPFLYLDGNPAGTVVASVFMTSFGPECFNGVPTGEVFEDVCTEEPEAFCTYTVLADPQAVPCPPSVGQIPFERFFSTADLNSDVE